MLLDFVALNIAIDRASKRNYATLRWNKTALGPQGQAETSVEIEDLRANKTTCNEIMAFLITL